MTKINKIVMNGFKSFGKHTELLFGERFNCILGPNGSGKSNVLDALCFVLGRGSAKALRAEKSANLIYNGGKAKNPSKTGKVAIFFDNTTKVFPIDKKEIEISRTVKQNGSSVYRINNEKRTKQEIRELLSSSNIDPDGYNIVLQGDIVRFVEMSPIERRQIIEDIAGISVYEERKLKALRELERVEEKLNEAEIILNERRSYLKELKKDRDHALKFKSLKDKVDKNKASYVYIRMKGKEKEHSKVDKVLQEEKKKFEKTEADMNKLKEQIVQHKQEIEKLNHEIEEKGEKGQVAIHKEVESLKIHIATNQTKVDNLKQEIERVKQRKSQLNSDITDVSGQLKKLEQEKKALEDTKVSEDAKLKQIESQIKKFKNKHKITDMESVEKEILELDNSTEEKEKEIFKIREKQQNLLREKDKIEYQLQTIDEKLEKVSAVSKEHNKQITELKAKKQSFKSKTLELNKILDQDSDFALKLSTLKQDFEKKQAELSRIKVKTLEINENRSHNRAVKSVLSQKSNITGICGTIADLGEVDSKYSFALESAAGPRINSIIVNNDQVAAECIKYLKKNRLGAARFIPLNKIKTPNLNPEAKKLKSINGVHGIASDLINYDNKYSKAFSYVFGSTLVVDSIDVSRRVGIGKIRMVSLDGDLTESSGLMYGGFRKRATSSFKEKGMINNLDKLESEVSSITQRIDDLQEKRNTNDESITKLRQDKAHLEGEVIKLEKSLHLESGDIGLSKQEKDNLNKQLKETDSILSSVQSEISKSNKELTQSKIKRQELKNKVMVSRNPRLVAELNAFEEEKQSLTQSLMKFDAEIKNMDMQKQLLSPENKKIQTILKQHNKEVEEFTNVLNLLNKETSKKTKELQEKEKLAKQFYAKYKKLFNQRNEFESKVTRFDTRIDALREISRKTEIQMNTFSLENVRLSSDLQNLQQEFDQYKEVEVYKDKSEQDLKREIDKFERMASDIGAVNMRALEVFDNVEKEYQGLISKKESLVVEKDDVFGMIQEIEGKKKSRFMKNFDIVNNNFKNFFTTLSTKGEAFLNLENQEIPFEGGLEVKVRLKGTKFMDIMSLSGGEKTLTALAFIFSIQEHKPHSFYILDEVDAALDKHNSEKLAKLIRTYVDKAQYIVISHNDALVSEADNLYGVSMDPHGITSVTSVKL